MTDPAASNPSIDSQALADLRVVMERQLAVLGRLAEAGLNLAIGVEQQATTDGPAKLAPGEAALAYARAARAVRLTVALQSKVIKDLQALDEVARRYRAGDRQQAEAAHEGRKARVQRLVERVIAAEVADEAEVDRLADEACERLEHDDIYGDLQTRSVGEIIALVCRDLGLSPDWSRWAEEAWAREEPCSRPAGSAFAAPRWPDLPDPTATADPDPTEPQAASP